MPLLANPAFLLTSFFLVILSPCLALFSLAVYRAAQQRSGREPDAKALSRIRALEIEKLDLLAQWEQSRAQTAQMVERIRMLERMLIEERRQRLSETSELLALRRR